MRESFIRSCSAIILTVCFGITGGWAQTSESTKNTADQTLRAAGRVNPSTLGMEMDIPLGGYPSRGINLPLGLSYSSKLWRFEQDSSIVQYNGSSHVYVRPKFAEDSASGWSSSLQPAYIEYTGEKDLFDDKGRPLQELYGPGPGPTGEYYVRRITAALPGGSSHVMIASFDPISTTPGQGAPASAWEGTFYATDGSGMKYVQDSTIGRFRLYMADGSYYDFNSTRENKHPGDLTQVRFVSRLTDVHGNYVQFTPATTTYPNGYWTDQLGRVFPVMIPRETPTIPVGASYVEQQFTYPGMSQPYTLRWKRLQGDSAANSAFTNFTTQVLHYDGHTDNGTNPGTYSPHLFSSALPINSCSSDRLFVFVTNFSKFNPVLLTEVVLPNGATYKFSYNEYGEIEQIHYPAGGREELEYAPVASLAELGKPYQISNRGVISRKIYESDSDTTADTWTYSAASSKNNFRTSVIAPDGTQTDRFMHRGADEMGIRQCSGGDAVRGKVVLVRRAVDEKDVDKVGGINQFNDILRSAPTIRPVQRPDAFDRVDHLRQQRRSIRSNDGRVRHG